MSRVDIHVGQRIKYKRAEKNLTLKKLAMAICVHEGQMMRYEAGTERISPTHLFNIGEILDVPIAYFFEDYDSTTQT